MNKHECIVAVQLPKKFWTSLNEKKSFEKNVLENLKNIPFLEVFFLL